MKNLADAFMWNLRLALRHASVEGTILLFRSEAVPMKINSKSSSTAV